MGDSVGDTSRQHARRGRWRQRLWWALWGPLVLLGLWLGAWQWERAGEKRDYLAALESAPHLEAPREVPPDGSRLTLSGEYLPELTLFLDNRVLEGRHGVAPLTPLRTDDGRLWLVQRGFLASGAGRETPEVATPEGSVTLEGRWQSAGSGTPLFGPNREGQRLQRIELTVWEEAFAHQGWLHLEAGPGHLTPWWSPSVMPPSRHLGYAVQWWGLALAALAMMLIGGRRLAQDARHREVQDALSKPGGESHE
ncbi:SURF1 family protein [Halomonas mongoliensis]|uniref:SURF1-like protein n=1 Tax=Halomonas mongoliensis TaxID=321265 RepID=A0ABU1GMJ7_9GAMM|nr:SURF1 family protein [Halomonas mongoliensis]MDR5892663.1 SURF1 family protein [Halomonas mongoliensis]